MVRIFGEYILGRGLYAIAEGLNRDGIVCPSAHDRRRNAHRTGVAWSKGAVRAILKNPRYTGHQVWNRQRKEERLIDVEDVALGHETRQRWNTESEWVWSKSPVHEPLVSLDTYRQVQDMMGAQGRLRARRDRTVTRQIYVFRGRLICGLCCRKMQGQKSRGDLYYRCRFPEEYALANKIWHPRNLYLPERELVSPVDAWIGQVCAPHRLDETVRALWGAQEDPSEDIAAERAREKIKKCDRNLVRYREALEAGAEAPRSLHGWRQPGLRRPKRWPACRPGRQHRVCRRRRFADWSRPSTICGRPCEGRSRSSRPNSTQRWDSS
ncbi:recombinase family protein [Streptomyces albus]|uniref:recombinase family protein n=1 Tax=Streptomyces sp. PHES57 TaxID=2872626 RepID=UPI001CECCCF1